MQGVVQKAGQWGLFLVGLALTGCMQLDTKVRLHEDGSATLTEKLRFSRRLLDLSGKEGGETDIASLLNKEAALERVKHLGKGASLVRHEVKDMEGGARESVAEYRIEDINALRYVSPWPAYVDYAGNNGVGCKLTPTYKSNPYANSKAGEMAVSFYTLKPPKGEAPLPKDAPPPKGPTPQEVEVYRDLEPVFRDMLKDFKLKLVFETYCPIARSGLGMRGVGAAPVSIELLHFSDKNLDKFNSRFIDNEELLLDLVRWNLGSPTIVEHVRNFPHNDTLPVFLPLGSRHMWWLGGGEIAFRPSRALFDKFFAGKKLDYSEWQASPPDKHVLAEFDKIGFKKEAAK